MAHYLICYDIASPKRLGKVHRRILRHAIFVQYSVYYLKGNKKALDAALEDIRDVLDEQQDDVRAYTVAPPDDAVQLGNSWLPDDVLLL